MVRLPPRLLLYGSSSTYLALVGPGWTPCIATLCMHTDNAAKTSASSYPNLFLQQSPADTPAESYYSTMRTKGAPRGIDVDQSQLDTRLQ